MSGQKAFLDVRIFDSNVSTYSKQTLKRFYFLTKNKKKHHCIVRILKVGKGGFRLLKFTVVGRMGGEGFTRGWQHYRG